MNDPEDGARETASAMPASGRFSGRSEFRQQVRDALAMAAREGWPEIILCDASFEDWPLGERAVTESLQAWSATGRRCTLLARRYDDLARCHPRFVVWRRAWSHIIDARGCASADPLDLPSALWSPSWAMHRLDPLRSAGVSGTDAQQRVLLRERINEWLRKSAPAFPATTLGL